jgi:hypothetical protein
MPQQPRLTSISKHPVFFSKAELSIPSPVHGQHDNDYPLPGTAFEPLSFDEVSDGSRPFEERTLEVASVSTRIAEERTFEDIPIGQFRKRS